VSNSINNPRRILKKCEAAEFLGVSERTLSRLHAEGKGPPRSKVGRSARYFEDNLVEWLESIECKGVRT